MAPAAIARQPVRKLLQASVVWGNVGAMPLASPPARPAVACNSANARRASVNAPSAAAEAASSLVRKC